MFNTSNLTFRHLRLTEAACFRKYLDNTRLWCEIGNEAFAAHVSAAGNDSNAETGGAEPDSAPWRLYHSWLPQIMELTNEQAANMKSLINGLPAAEMTAEQQHWVNSLATAGWLSDGPADINNLVDRALQQIIAIQNRYELTEYLKIVQEKKPRVIVEIGTARGGMLYCFCQLAAPDAIVVSIDLPGAPNCGGQTPIERQFYSTFAGPEQKIHFIPSNSHFHATKQMLKGILGHRKADLLFIDGDHSYGGVKIDYEMYAEVLAPDGLLTFHDIRLRPEHWGPGNEVGVFWDEIASGHEVTEIVDPEGVCRPNRPEGVDPCWGIGILGKRNTSA